MSVRSFLSIAVTAALSATPLLARPDLATLRASFEQLPPSARAYVQQELRTLHANFHDGDGSLYLANAPLDPGAPDGRYGPGTERAQIAGAAYLAENSAGRCSFDLDMASGARAYVATLASGEAAAWLYGEGEDGE